MREPLWILQKRFVNQTLPLPIAKAYIYILLNGLDYLHSTCKVVHTGKTCLSLQPIGGFNKDVHVSDLKLDNILMSFENGHLLSDFVEKRKPMEYKTTAGRTIYRYHNDLCKHQATIIHSHHYFPHQQSDHRNRFCVMYIPGPRTFLVFTGLQMHELWSSASLSRPHWTLRQRRVTPMRQSAGISVTLGPPTGRYKRLSIAQQPSTPQHCFKVSTPLLRTYANTVSEMRQECGGSRVCIRGFTPSTSVCPAGSADVVQQQ